jgi:hypothetical protein
MNRSRIVQLASPRRSARCRQRRRGRRAGGVFAGDVGNALWTLVIFGSVVFVLGKFAWKPILNGLQAREAFIRESLEEARRDRAEAERG